MVDQVLILRKLAELEKYLAQIREFSSISVRDTSKILSDSRMLSFRYWRGFRAVSRVSFSKEEGLT